MPDSFHSNSKLAEQLEHFILQQLEPNPSVRHDNPQELTIGIEHEFFLASPDGEPATHEESQLLFRTMSEQPGWHIQQIEREVIYGEYIARVSKNHANGRYTALKYDHHPHLLEVAFGYSNSMKEMNQSVTDFFSLLEKVADQLNLRILSVPSIPQKANDSRVTSELSEFKNLRHYRKILLDRKLQHSDPLNANYAAVIAATQTHIGGTQWWRRPAYVRSLYSFEPLLTSYALMSLESEIGGAKEVLRKRWAGYNDVFSEYPLVGFPKLPDWSMKLWIQSMLDSPLYGGPLDSFAGKTVNELHENPFSTWTGFIKSVRDLQLIRPKLFGTLEFRADPAQPDASSIISMSCLRLGICSALIGPSFSPPSFSASRENWLSTIAGKSLLQSEEITEFAMKGLRSRGFGEEAFVKLPRRKESAKRDEEKATG